MGGEVTLESTSEREERKCSCTEKRKSMCRCYSYRKIHLPVTGLDGPISTRRNGLFFSLFLIDLFFFPSLFVKEGMHCK